MLFGVSSFNFAKTVEIYFPGAIIQIIGGEKVGRKEKRDAFHICVRLYVEPDRAFYQDDTMESGYAGRLAGSCVGVGYVCIHESDR